jgi:cell wall-associated NlpC family hydrolase
LRSRIELRRAAAGVVALAAFAVAAPAGASTGGTSTETETTGPPGKAKLRKGKAIPPSDAPRRVVKAIEAANEIVKGKGYCLGGGHSRWKSKCYDCSGAVSYALKGARMLDSPLPSGSLARWGKKGKGDWITVYANGGHAYAVIAGLRLDTSMTAGAGPGWSKEMRSSRGFKKRRFKKGF